MQLVIIAHVGVGDAAAAWRNSELALVQRPQMGRQRARACQLLDFDELVHRPNLVGGDDFISLSHHPGLHHLRLIMAEAVISAIHTACSGTRMSADRIIEFTNSPGRRVNCCKVLATSPRTVIFRFHRSVGESRLLRWLGLQRRLVRNGGQPSLATFDGAL